MTQNTQGHIEAIPLEQAVQKKFEISEKLRVSFECRNQFEDV
jgi:hypothetical protein